MKNIEKVIALQDCRLTALFCTREQEICKCSGKLEVVKDVFANPKLGKAYIVNGRDVRLNLTFDDVPKGLSEDMVGLRVEGYLEVQEDRWEPFVYNQCELLSHWDPLLANGCVLKVPLSHEDIKELYNRT